MKKDNMEKTIVQRIENGIVSLRIIEENGNLDFFLKSLQEVVDKKNQELIKMGVKSGQAKLSNISIKLDDTGCKVALVIESVLGEDVLLPILSELEKTFVNTDFSLWNNGCSSDNMQRWQAKISYPRRHLSDIEIKVDEYTIDLATRAKHALIQIPEDTVDNIETFLLNKKGEYEKTDQSLQIEEFCSEDSESPKDLCYLQRIMTYGQVPRGQTKAQHLEFMGRINSIFKGSHQIPVTDSEGKKLVFGLSRTHEIILKGKFTITIL